MQTAAIGARMPSSASSHQMQEGKTRGRRRPRSGSISHRVDQVPQFFVDSGGHRHAIGDRCPEQLPIQRAEAMQFHVQGAFAGTEADVSFSERNPEQFWRVRRSRRTFVSTAMSWGFLAGTGIDQLHPSVQQTFALRVRQLVGYRSCFRGQACAK